MIVTLGRYSMARFFPGETIGKAHGKARREGGLIYYAMYHPAAALHQQGLRDTIKADMRRIPSLLIEAEPQPDAEMTQKPQQLSFL
jgi:DNA polymerase